MPTKSKYQDPQYQTNWDLVKYFYKNLEDPELESDIQKIKTIAQNFKDKYKSQIAKLDIDGIKEMLSDDSKLSEAVNKPGFYLFYRSVLESQNQEILKKEGELDNLLAQISNELTFVDQEFKAMGYDKVLKISQDLELKDYQNYFFQKAKNLKYIQSEETEKALNLKSVAAASSLQKLRSELTGSFMYEISELDDNGKPTDKMITIPEPQLLARRISPIEAVRKEASEKLYAKYSDKTNQITLGNIYTGIVKESVSSIQIRGFENVMQVRNVSEELPDSSVNMLLEEVQKAYPLVHRYYKAKQKLLLKRPEILDIQSNTEKLQSWNRSAPLTTKQNKIEFTKALDIFLETLKGFDQEFYDFSRAMFLEGRVDVYPKEGKRGGAFASYAKNYPSFVLLNYTGDLDGVSTIAHELGHAIHGHFSQTQVDQVYDTGLALAETASIFNEMLFSEAFIKTLNDDEDKIQFLNSRLGDVIATIFRQVMYTLFEREVHQSLMDGKELSYEDYNRLWTKHETALVGDSVQMPDPMTGSPIWSYIPHIFKTPFYCYTYAFGNITTFALYEQYKEKGPKFIEDYKNILKSGGSKSPYDTMQMVGLDINSPEFYRKGLKVVEEMLKEYESLV